MKATFTLRACAECGRSFRMRSANHRLCSERCRNKQRNIQQIVPVVTPSRAMVGEAAELFVAADLMRQGICVFQNVARTGPADLVAWLPDRHEVAFIDVKGLTSAFRRSDGSLAYNHAQAFQDPDRQTWIVRVVGNEIHYPPTLISLLHLNP